MAVADQDGRIGIDFGVYGVPESFLIDKVGIIRYKQIGPFTEEALRDKLIPLIKELTNEVSGHPVFHPAMRAGVYANEATPLADDPVVEQRLVVIAEELRCLVCQNESLAGSRADLAMDLRREVRALIKSGKSDAQIKEYLVSRYGDFVLYRPPIKPTTWLLWFGPLLLLIGAFWVLVNIIRRSQNQKDTPTLDAAQRAKAQALLQETDSSK